jgi:hypothetical protein
MFYLPIAFYIGYSKRSVGIAVAFLVVTAILNYVVSGITEGNRKQAGLSYLSDSEVAIGSIFSSVIGLALILTGRGARYFVDRFRSKHD